MWVMRSSWKYRWHFSRSPPAVCGLGFGDPCFRQSFDVSNKNPVEDTLYYITLYSIICSIWGLSFWFKIKESLPFFEELEYFLIPVTKLYNLVCPLSSLWGNISQIWNNHENSDGSELACLHYLFPTWFEFPFSFIMF